MSSNPTNGKPELMPVTGFTQTDNTIIREGGLSGNALALYVILSSFADNSTGEAYPSKATLAKLMQFKKPDSVNDYVAELQKLGLVTVADRYTDTGARTSNLYTVRRSIPLASAEQMPATCQDDGTTPVDRSTPPAAKGDPYPAQRVAPTPDSGYELYPGELDPRNNTQGITTVADARVASERELIAQTVAELRKDDYPYLQQDIVASVQTQLAAETKAALFDERAINAQWVVEDAIDSLRGIRARELEIEGDSGGAYVLLSPASVVQGGRQ